MNQIQSQPTNSNEILYRRDPNPLSSVQLSMLETIIPIAGADLLSDVLDWFSFTSYTWIFRLITITLAVISSATYFWSRILYYTSLYYEASVTIEATDMIHTHVMTWLAENISTRRLQAKTAKATRQIEDQSRVMEYSSKAKDGKFHLLEWQKFSKPDFEPHVGEHAFYFQGRRFWITRSKDDQAVADLYKQVSIDKIEYIRISCWGQSTDPIKDFLQEAKRSYLSQECSKTTIFRSKDLNWSPKWVHASTRPSRPINTVSLNESTKRELLGDINEFLDPRSPRWYANRGIPYRRGYLLHGPPGTGKSSLTLALGGLFGLPIYYLGLDGDMTEDKLMACFGDLPSRCIVLIEDIDTVEITRRRDEKAGETKKAREDSKLTLSGLLNVIDGVASHEGRILIMTTNHPEKLDPALVRKGRVDLEVRFGLATKEQIVNLFMIMYSHDYDDERDVDDISRDKLLAAAHAFGELLPADKFSPAEIQDFLTLRKDDYRKALREAEQWKESMLAKRESGINPV